MTMVRGQKAWALERWDEIAQHRKPLPSVPRTSYGVANSTWS